MSKKIQRPISILTSITTIAWLSGVAMLAPLAVGAAIVDGDIVSPDAEFTEGEVTYYPYDVFIVKIMGSKTFKRLILNPEVFESYGHLEWGNIQTISADTVDGYTTSDLVRELNDTKVYKLTPDGDVGTKQWLNVTAAEFETDGYDWDSIYVINVTDRDNYTTGASITAGGVEEPITESTGTLTVSLAADTPAAAFALKNSARVPFTKINLTATGGDVIIDSMKVQRTGSPASDAALSGVNVLKPDGDMLSSTYKTFNSDHQASFTQNVTIANGTTASYMLVGKIADSDSYAGEVPTLSLVEVNLSGDATLNATLPIAGNAMTINTTVTIAALDLSETPDVGIATKEVGTTDFDFVHIRMAGTVADLRMESIKFNNVGSADDADVANMKLLYYNTSEVLATADMVSNYIYFDLSDCGELCEIDKGKNKTYTLRGDIVGGSGRDLDFDLKRVEHVVAKDLLNNVWITPTGTTNYGNIITISRGKLNVNKTNTVKTSNISADSTGVELASWNFKVRGESITVSTIAFLVDVNGTGAQAADFTSLILTNRTTGETLTGGFDGVGAGDGAATSSDSFTLPIGSNEIVLTGNISADPQADAWVQFSVNFAHASTNNLDATGDVTGDAITIGTYVTPQALISANKQTFKDLSLAITTLAQPAEKTIAAGTSNIHYSTISFDASDSSENVKVTQFKFSIVSSVTAIANEIQNIKFEVDGTDIGVTENGTETVNTDTQEQITVSLSGDEQFVITKGTTAIMKIYADLATGATAAGTHRLQISTEVTVNDTVTAIGEISGNAITEGYSSAAANDVIVGTAGGTVKVTADSSNPVSALLTAGTTGVTLAAFNFLATSTEDVELDYLYLTQLETDTDSSSYKDYDRIYFEDEDGNEMASMTPTSTFPKMNFASDDFIVDISDTDGQILYLKADLAAIGSGYNGRAGNYLGYKIAATADVIANGALTGSGSHEYISSPDGNTFYGYKSYPTFAKVTVATNKLGNGTMDLYKFTVTADSSGDIALYQFTFDISTTVATVVATSLYVYDVTASTEVALNATAGSAHLGIYEIGAWDGSGISGNEVVISKGTSHTFVLRGNITAAAAGASVTTRVGGDDVRINHLAEESLMDTAAHVDGASTNNDFIWSDKSDGAHSITTDDWTNGYLVPGLPSSSSTAETVAY